VVSSSRRRTDLPSGEVHSITTAPEALADDLARRQKRYLVQMGIRVVCFAVAVISWGRIPMWASLVLLVAAVVLPYSAVLFANAGRERRDTDGSFMTAHEIDPGGGAPRGLHTSDRPEGPA
jgi:Flp pilus assembly protein TadB